MSKEQSAKLAQTILNREEEIEKLMGKYQGAMQVKNYQYAATLAKKASELSTQNVQASQALLEVLQTNDRRRMQVAAVAITRANSDTPERVFEPVAQAT